MLQLGRAAGDCAAKQELLARCLQGVQAGAVHFPGVVASGQRGLRIFAHALPRSVCSAQLEHCWYSACEAQRAFWIFIVCGGISCSVGLARQLVACCSVCMLLHSCVA